MRKIRIQGDCIEHGGSHTITVGAASIVTAGSFKWENQRTVEYVIIE